MTVIRKLALLLCVAAGAASACGGSSDQQTATSPSIVVGPQSELFEGTVDPGGFAFYSFTVQQTGNVSLMLASVTASKTPGTSSTVTLGLAIGTPSGTDCSITTSIQASAALTYQLVNNMTPGIYCARVYDVGNLRSTVNFAARITHT